MKNKFTRMRAFIPIVMFVMSCKIIAQTYVLIGWNDLGMHCANKNFSTIAILPPFNNIYAQLIKNTPGQIPQIITSGVIVEYSIPGNTYSIGKTNFWTYAQQLFSLPQPLPDNIGLTGKGLTGTLDPQGNYFFARGIPITPFQDNNLITESPFQLIHLVAKDQSSLQVLATTDVVIPVSNEIGCVQSGCHSSEQNILNQHEGSTLTPPVLCANCHADNALGLGGNPNLPSLSEVIHGQHSELGLPATTETCYKCHPGPITQCLRDVMSQITIPTIQCENCHGTLQAIAQSINNGREPWLEEPKCGDVLCHGSQYAEQPGKLFRESQGHGNLFCSACHSSPHAILPSREANDNLQNIILQGFSGTLQVCIVCHGDNPTSGGPHQSNPSYFQLSVNVVDHWNMVSTPGINQAGMEVGTWWPHKTGTVWGFNGTQYVAKTVATPGEGYWMKNTLTETYNYPAIQIVAHNPIPVTLGWNMIGGYETSPTIVALKAANPQIMGTIWSFNGIQYVIATNLVPGYSYWVKVTSAGTITIPDAMAKGETTAEIFPESWGKIILTDATGLNFTLYAVKGDSPDGGASVDLSQYELPPLPPAGAFDIRFSSGRIVEDINSSVKTIDMTGVTYPLTVRVEGMDIKLMDETGKMINLNLKKGEDVVISDATIQKLMVSGELIPDKYSLEQNYPNPFNPATVISWQSPVAGWQTIKIYDVLGKEIMTLVDEYRNAGKYQIELNAEKLASGVYFYQLRSGDFVSIKKMLLLK
jgi:hypothetical protein